MGKAPAVIIIARHGARLDAGDAHWVDTAARPYDPPLSYGGWTQTRALGARIAALLRERDFALGEEEENSRKRRRSPNSASSNADEQADTGTKRRRRKKVVIHTSPFLRCVQSSIAISAGIAQYQGNLKRFEAAQIRATRQRPSTAPTRSLTLDPSVLEAKYGGSGLATRSKAASEERPKTAGTDVDAGASSDEGPWKPTLRVDAFLGEWLSPTYYELIAAPPFSHMMVAGAKADLIRPATPIQGSQMAPEPSQSSQRQSSSPAPPPSARKSSTNSVTFDLPELKEALSSIDESPTSPPSQPAHGGGPRARHKSVSTGYVPPLPNYAISATEPIPPGYVAHARDSCVRLDYQWDSAGSPQDWGDGGEYGEDWALMHNRFRKGLMELVSWYKSHSLYFDPQDEDDVDDGPDTATEGAKQEEDEDLIVILVTHSAGCNALIGAITNHPVLLDVGMGSLTMAVHKSQTEGGTSQQTGPPPFAGRGRRRSSVDATHAHEYEMKITASMDHLRAGADPLRIPALQNSPYLTAIPEGGGGARRRDTLKSAGDLSTPESEFAPSGKVTSLGSVLRARSGTTGSTHTVGSESGFLGGGGGGAHRNGCGLWTGGGGGSGASSMSAAVPVGEPVHTAPSRENSVDGKRGGSAAGGDDDDAAGEGDFDAVAAAAEEDLPRRALSQRGLWAGGRKTSAPARRWTLNVRNG